MCTLFSFEELRCTSFAFRLQSIRFLPCKCFSQRSIWSTIHVIFSGNFLLHGPIRDLTGPSSVHHRLRLVGNGRQLVCTINYNKVHKLRKTGWRRLFRLSQFTSLFIQQVSKHGSSKVVKKWNKKNRKSVRSAINRLLNTLKSPEGGNKSHIGEQIKMRRRIKHQLWSGPSSMWAYQTAGEAASR
jgi:hypothetical protein